jgi:predicted kinase
MASPVDERDARSRTPVSPQTAGRLLFFCGKMAAGKSTLARELAQREDAVLLVQDHFLAALYPGEILTVADYMKYSSRLRDALTPHICSLLSGGTSVVLDFPGNTRGQRAWFRALSEASGAEHELHFIDASDDLCKRQLRERSKDLPPGTPWTTDADFDAITAYFEPPAPEEHFHVVRHEPADEISGAAAEIEERL